MKIFGLTGGIGMGKSTAGTRLRDLGIPVVDTDDLARQAVEPGQPALQEVIEAFGAQVIDQRGVLRRDELARIVFGDPAARGRLETILHPRIRQFWMEQAKEWSRQGARNGVVIIPLLFETGAERDVDVTICVACSAVTQRRRLMERGWSNDQIEQRISAQLPIEEKMQRADYLLWSEGSVEVLSEQLKRIMG